MPILVPRKRIACFQNYPPSIPTTTSSYTIAPRPNITGLLYSRQISLTNAHVAGGAWPFHSNQISLTGPLWWGVPFWRGAAATAHDVSRANWVEFAKDSRTDSHSAGLACPEYRSFNVVGLSWKRRPPYSAPRDAGLVEAAASKM